MLTHIELPFDYIFLIVSSQFIVVFTFSTADNFFELLKNRKAAQYELTSPIFYMEQYIPFSLFICEPFSQIFRNLCIFPHLVGRVSKASLYVQFIMLYFAKHVLYSFYYYNENRTSQKLAIISFIMFYFAYFEQYLYIYIYP